MPDQEKFQKTQRIRTRLS